MCKDLFCRKGDDRSMAVLRSCLPMVRCEVDSAYREGQNLAFDHHPKETSSPQRLDAIRARRERTERAGERAYGSSASEKEGLILLLRAGRASTGVRL